MLVFTARGMQGRLAIRTQHVLLTDTNTLRPWKDITGLTVRLGAGIKETAEILRTLKYGRR